MEMLVIQELGTMVLIVFDFQGVYAYIPLLFLNYLIFTYIHT